MTHSLSEHSTLDQNLKRQYECTIQQIVKEELSWEKDLPMEHFSEHLDSLQKLSLLVAIEDHFEIAFNEEDDAQINTLHELVGRIHHKETQKATLHS
ncbi:MAG: hypothetical protein CMK59_02385 [Proteobacteria bacterium]|nr:hypothetical protein [Pseudomonadota bacterium]